MSRCHYTPSPRQMSMAELNHNKTLNMRLADHLRSLAVELNDPRYESQAERVHYCSTFWQGMYCPTCKKFHYMHTTGCKHRLCPICATRASRVTAAQALEAMEWMHNRHEGLKCSLLTLTQRNVEGPALNDEISRMLKGWYNVINQRLFRFGTIGWARTIEIVPSINHDGTYHPHVHAIIVHKGELRLSLEWFIQRWRSGMHLNYDPVCDLRPIDDEEGAVYEVSKYISKMTRVYDMSPQEHDHVRWLAEATYNRRLRTYGGDWRIARIQLSQRPVEIMEDDEISEYGEMQNLDAICPHCSSGTIFSTLRWAGLKYAVMPEQISVIPFPTTFQEKINGPIT